jgi:hypothetical protein
VCPYPRRLPSAFDTGMLTIETQATVEGISGSAITDFLLDCSDERYQQWWPDTHLHLHALRSQPNHRGDVVYMDEYVGTRHVRMTGVVVEAIPGSKIVWQLKKGLRLPVRLTLSLTDHESGVALRHTITAGWHGVGRVLDPLLALWFSPAFVAAMDQHVRTEFPLLRDRLLQAARSEGAGPQHA